MTIDMHTHTSELSHCSFMSAEQLLKAAVDIGLDAVVITDHHRFRSCEEMEKLKRKFPDLRVFQGIEITTPYRGAYEGEDFLLYGVYDPILEEQRSWTYEELYSLTRQWDGWITLAHPFRYKNHISEDIESLVPDAIEIHSSSIYRGDTPTIMDIANRLNCRPFHSSDSHRTNEVGIYYMQLPTAVNSEKELIETLRAGDIRLHERTACIDEINRFTKNQENLIRKMIKQGKTASEYAEETGRWEIYFEKVAMGKSYEI